jgi:putative ABC transport system permease protein
VVKEIIQSHGLAVPKTYPIVRSRILKVNDLDFERKVESAQLAQMTREEEQEIRFRNRGLNLSFREQIGEGEELVEGSFISQKWDKQSGKPFAVSLEKSYATRLKLQMGDRLRFDVQGIELEGIVTSIRRVRWTTFQPNFFVLVQPGVLEDAPHTLIAAIPQTDTDRKTAIQKDFSRKLSNVSLINVEKTVKDTIEILDKLSWSLEIMAAVALVGGYIVMISVMLSQWIQRRWQSSLLKSIGCGTQDLVGLSLRESILMASVGAVIGGLSSGVLASGLSYYMFDEVFAWNGKTIFLNTILIVILGILTTLFAIGYVSRSRPAELLSEFASEASSE